jgi:hypothetical protein
MSDHNPQSEQASDPTVSDPRAPEWHPTLAPEKSPAAERSESSSPVQLTIVSHSNEEYRHMAVYLRLKGIVPPRAKDGDAPAAGRLSDSAFLFGCAPKAGVG